MGQKTYEFLNDSFLFDRKLLKNNYSRFSDSELRDELTRYREFVLSNLDKLEHDKNGKCNRLNVFVAQDCLSMEKLKQSALYFDQLVFPDPLFKFTAQPSNSSDAFREFLNFPSDENVSRVGLVKAIHKMTTLAPMVDSNYLKFVPVSYFFEPPEDIPLRYSETAFSDSLPTSILNEYRNKARVYSLKQSDGTLSVEKNLRISRHIAIQFEGDSIENFHGFTLIKSEFKQNTNKSREFIVKMTCPIEAPSIEEFKTWVNQSINQAATEHYTRLSKEFAIASETSASYLTTSEFTNSLLGVRLPDQSIGNSASRVTVY